MPTGLYAPSWTPKVTAFTSEGQLSPEFQMQNIGYGLGGVYTAGLENNIGQGSGRCLAVNPNDDGNDRWEIFVGGAFVNIIQAGGSRTVLKPANYIAKLYGFRNTVDPNFSYCLDGMTLQNFGSVWGIDHIVPVELFNLSDPEELKLCYNYNNIMPMYNSDNRMKGASVHFSLIKLESLPINTFVERLKDKCRKEIELTYNKYLI
jgi:hypothetical protein